MATRRRRSSPAIKIAIFCLSLILALGILNVSYALWSQTLFINGTIQMGRWCNDREGSPGFWKNWDSHHEYDEEEIEDWLEECDDDSSWLGPTNTEDMEDLFDEGEGGSPQSKFLRAYLALRLDVYSGRLNKVTIHDFSGYDPANYLGLGGSGNLPQIIAAMEGKYGTHPSGPEFLTMKNICEALYSLSV